MKQFLVLIAMTTSILSTNASEMTSIDLQIDTTAAETIYHESGDTLHGLDESVTKRTGLWRCIAKDNKNKSFIAFHQDQETSIIEAVKKCEDSSSGCKRISCRTN